MFLCIRKELLLTIIMIIARLQKVSLVDYPSKICATIFFQGCNFRCLYCYNSKLIQFSEPKSQISEEEILVYLEKRKGLIEAVCLTGGEPVLQDGLSNFLRRLKEMGFLVKIDTNGSNPEILDFLLNQNLVDYIALDLKAPLIWRKYKRVINIDNKEMFDKILKSVKLLLNSKIDYEFRTTVVPVLLKKDDIKEIIRQIKGAKKYALQGFINDKEMVNEEYRNIKPYPKTVLKEMAEEARNYINECEVRL